MKHIAVRSLSLRKIAPYTVPGLGDRIHAALMGYNYSVLNDTPVTLHLTDDKWSIAGGVISDKKKKSWDEILKLFPSGHLFLETHPVENLPEKDWIAYLKNKGFDAQTYFYKDTPHRYDFPEGVGEMFDAGEIMSRYPRISPIVDIQLPKKFVTAQFDCNNVPYWQSSPDTRKINPMIVESILSKYKSQGYEIVFIGGDGKGNMKGPGNLKNIGCALSKADYHVGADSGFLHMAQLYMKPEQIKLHVKGLGGSHHVIRCQNNGVEVIRW